MEFLTLSSLQSAAASVAVAVATASEKSIIATTVIAYSTVAVACTDNCSHPHRWLYFSEIHNNGIVLPLPGTNINAGSIGLAMNITPQILSPSGLVDFDCCGLNLFSCAQQQLPQQQRPERGGHCRSWKELSGVLSPFVISNNTKTFGPMARRK
jgi:hypothetical protein